MLTDDEKKYLKELVKRQLEALKNEEKTIVHQPFPQFQAAEEKYEDFLEGILKKL